MTVSALLISARTLLKISRPRFWLYLAGPYLIGVAAGTSTPFAAVPEWSFWMHLLYFLVPANVFLYGINDLCDRDTDQFNPKKGREEHLLKRSEDVMLMLALVCAVLLAIPLVIGEPDGIVALWAIFFFLSWAYSSPPLRFKAHPIIDSASNILYVMPGIIGYALQTGELPAYGYILAAGLWTAGMHLFSAIPDIESDKAAGLTTTAVLFRKKLSILLCGVLWFGAAACVWLAGEPVFAAVGVVYGCIPLCFLRGCNAFLRRVYWSFPLINSTLGFALFAYAVYT